MEIRKGFSVRKVLISLIFLRNCVVLPLFHTPPINCFWALSLPLSTDRDLQIGEEQSGMEDSQLGCF